MRHWQRKPKRSQDDKYSNRRSLCALGHSHRSMLEGSVCQILQYRERAGELKLLQVEDHIYLTKARIAYVADFKCQDLKTGEIFWVESKGYSDQKWPIKKKLWRYYGPGKLELWIGTYLSPKLDEVIIPAVNENDGIL